MSNSLRKALVGYDILKSEGKIARVFDLKQELTTTPISGIKGKASKLVFGSGIAQAELITRQYLLLLLAGLELNKHLLSSYSETEKEATFILPKEWRKIIGRYGINVSEKSSSLAWNKYLLRYLYRCCKVISKEIVYAVLQIFNIRPLHKPQTTGNYAFFCYLNENNIPRISKDDENHDIISWYIDWKGRNRQIDTVCHSVKNETQIKYNGIDVIYIDGPVPPLNTKRSLIIYSGWCMRIFVSCLVSFIRGRWWNLIMLDEAILASKIRFQKKDSIGKEYLFHNSSWMYKPLWTYEAENKGAGILFYFYSTNCEGFKAANDRPAYYYGFDSMNWPTYLVWDEYQADFVRKLTGSSQADIRVVGPISFSCSNAALPPLPKTTIAVFDVQPMKDSFYKTLASDFDFYTPENSIRFLGDIYSSCERSGYSMVLKRKREGGKYVHREYRKMIKNLDSLPNYLYVDPDLSAYKLIENALAVISMPFTSTALIARYYNKPSVYYDPLRLLQKDDPAAHGIMIIQGSDELNTWISTLNLN